MTRADTGGEYGPDDEGVGRPRSRRKPLLLTVAVVALAAVAAGAFVLGGSGKADGTAKVNIPRTQTVAVSRADLSDTKEIRGTLGFGAEKTLKSGRKGLITKLPAEGDTIKRGRPLFWVDDRPVVAFTGATPLYRTLTPPKDAGAKPLRGRDVKMVADNLRALGYDIGAQPAPGYATGSPTAGGRTAGDEGEFTQALSAALKRWQKHIGTTPTGTLAVGDVQVLPGEVRIGAVTAGLGDEATEPVLTVSSMAKAVTVPVDATEAGQVKKGAKVTVVLPNGTEAEGRVDRIGRAATPERGAAGAGGEGTPNAPQKLDVTVLLSDRTKVDDLDAASVTVRFTTQTHKNVLTVPVGALTALREGGYAVQLARTNELVAVRTGMFARGLVEITSPTLTEGTKVVTAS
ncbi:hypothetical protein ACH4SP_14280 [Streptomyces sp. NPDC021093]|uniref:hypothetical protein n=1 Tax=Streptomyces sp. NPDC021093 TaxID=3365112 RepID=UPI0037B68C93